MCKYEERDITGNVNVHKTHEISLEDYNTNNVENAIKIFVVSSRECLYALRLEVKPSWRLYTTHIYIDNDFWSLNIVLVGQEKQCNGGRMEYIKVKRYWYHSREKLTLTGERWATYVIGRKVLEMTAVNSNTCTDPLHKRRLFSCRPECFISMPYIHRRNRLDGWTTTIEHLNEATFHLQTRYILVR